MATLGLDIVFTLVTAAAGGLLAAMLAYYLFGRDLSAHPPLDYDEPQPDDIQHHNLLDIIRQGGKDAWDISMSALPLLVVALVGVKIVDHSGVIAWLSQGFTPVFTLLGYPADSLALIVTKYIAGGTAMMGLAMEQMQAGVLDSTQLNRLAGLLLCPLDVAGVAILASAGKRVMAVAKPAVIAALLAVFCRAAVHIWMF